LWAAGLHGHALREDTGPRILGLRAGYMYDKGLRPCSRRRDGNELPSRAYGRTDHPRRRVRVLPQGPWSPSGLAPATVSGYKTRPRAAPHRFTDSRQRRPTALSEEDPKAVDPRRDGILVYSGGIRAKFGENASSDPAKGPKADEISLGKEEIMALALCLAAHALPTTLDEQPKLQPPSQAAPTFSKGGWNPLGAPLPPAGKHTFPDNSTCGFAGPPPGSSGDRPTVLLALTARSSAMRQVKLVASPSCTPARLLARRFQTLSKRRVYPSPSTN
jgi:hypothetical protein